MGKESEKEYMCVCVYIYIYESFFVLLKLIEHYKSTVLQ